MSNIVASGVVEAKTQSLPIPAVEVRSTESSLIRVTGKIILPVIANDKVLRLDE